MRSQSPDARTTTTNKNNSGVLDEADGDPWCLPHLYLPFVIQMLLRNWLVSVLIVFVWETLEQLIRTVFGFYPFLGTQRVSGLLRKLVNCTRTRNGLLASHTGTGGGGREEPLETPFNAIVVDPVLGAAGIGLAALTVYLLDLPHVRGTSGTDWTTVLQLALFVVFLGSHSGFATGSFVLATLGTVYIGPLLYLWNRKHVGSNAHWPMHVLLAVVNVYFVLVFVTRPLRVLSQRQPHGHYAWNAAFGSLLYVLVLLFVRFATTTQPL